MRKILCLLFFATCMLFCNNSFSQIYLFIKALDNNGVLLNGGSIQAGHTGQIDGLSYSQGASNACTTCVPQGSDFTFMMVLNPAAVGIRQMLFKSLHLQSVDITYQKPGTSGTIDFYKMHMENVIITSYQESGSNEIPTVSVSINPAKQAWQFTATKTDGTAGAKTKGGWDFSSNTEYSYY
jgi:type VI secretion system secreted protein Hcp